MKEIYIDCEWFISGELFLIGYCYSKNKFDQLHHKTLTKKKFLNLLNPGITIYCYGPDIAILEKYFNIDIRNKYNCVNLLYIFRKFLKGPKNYKLNTIEKYFGIQRTVDYKAKIHDMFRDWFTKPQYVIKYNQEDVINLYLVKQLVFKKHNIRKKDITYLT